ncbi:LytR/AlgR family response regulator transcription factor [Alteriqipengyuania lutimaris]|uniref:DNA-binding response regulator n=1 Tax=Alteriqipengyuania lutimaris TaxID=1538146 RepID=A0A395LME0_9SPHN|nr:LytTR family DNA-binding domain-containing protein [Alteriqipengyuania lutimaris]MBB3034463.1 two-component system response regulator AlgR [Alteriqipengyuania lutimaris]RDS76644.1 DNA-binding response regulator [Alteriqipengyuania lutimaris]
MENNAPLRVVLVDDEPLAIERLETLCGRIADVQVVGTADHGEAALDVVETGAPDLVLLDLTMPGLDGIEVAKRLAKMASPPAIIFVTAHESFAVEAFDLDAVDYVLKPVASERLERAIARALAKRGEAPQTSETRWLRELWVPHRSELVRVSVADVRRIDAERDYVRLFVGDKTYLLLQTIAGLEKKLDPEQFIRIHRSTILRKDHIAGLRHDGLGVWSVELGDGETLRIGRTYLPKVKAMAGR